MQAAKQTSKQLREENKSLRRIVRDLAWMARRYADGRRSVVPGLYNDRIRQLLAMGVELNPTAEGTIWASDSMGRDYDGLDDEHLTPGRAVATGRLLGLPPRTRLNEAILRELGLSEGAGAEAAFDAILALKECAKQGSEATCLTP